MANNIDIIIKQTYKKLLQREPDESGYKYFYNLLVQRIINEDQFIDTIKMSDEYLNMHMKNTESLVKKYDLFQNLKIKYYGHIGNTGYCDWIRNLVYTLVEYGAQIEFQCISVCGEVLFDTDMNSNETVLKQHLLSELSTKKLDGYDLVIIHTIPDNWPIYCAQEKKKNPSIKIYGITVWECDKIPIRWVKIINSTVDRLIVPSEWNKEIFSKDVIKPIHVVHHIIKEPEILINNKKIINIDDDAYVFYTIAEWHGRKRLEVLIRDYLKIFTKNDKVVLFIKTFFGNYSQKNKNILSNYIHQIINEFSSPARVIYYLEPLTDNEIYQIHLRGDCYVSPFTDGLGFGSLMAASMGKRIITTDYGGQREYLKDVNFITYRLMPAQMCDCKPYDHTICQLKGFCIYFPQYDPKTQKWAEPDSSHTQNLMMKAYENRSSSKLQDVTKKYILENFSSDKIVHKIKDILL